MDFEPDELATLLAEAVKGRGVDAQGNPTFPFSVARDLAVSLLADALVPGRFAQADPDEAHDLVQTALFGVARQGSFTLESLRAALAASLKRRRRAPARRYRVLCPFSIRFPEGTRFPLRITFGGFRFRIMPGGTWLLRRFARPDGLQRTYETLTPSTYRSRCAALATWVWARDDHAAYREGTTAVDTFLAALGYCWDAGTSHYQGGMQEGIGPLPPPPVYQFALGRTPTDLYGWTPGQPARRYANLPHVTSTQWRELRTHVRRVNRATRNTALWRAVLAPSLKCYRRGLDAVDRDEAFLYFWRSLELACHAEATGKHGVLERLQPLLRRQTGLAWPRGLELLKARRNAYVHSLVHEPSGLRIVNYTKCYAEYALDTALQAARKGFDTATLDEWYRNASASNRQLHARARAIRLHQRRRNRTAAPPHTGDSSEPPS